VSTSCIYGPESQAFLVLSPFESTNEFKSDRHRTRLNKRKVVKDSLMNTREELFAGEFDGCDNVPNATLYLSLIVETA
jgi:hypothetical protein